MSDEIVVFPNRPEGAPLRRWDDEGEEAFYARDAELFMVEAQAHASVHKLIGAPSTIDADDLVAFGRLNSAAFFGGYEPLISLLREPVIHPRLPGLLREHTDFFVRRR